MTALTIQNLRPQKSVSPSENFSTEADVIKKVENLYQKGVIKKLELQGSYKSKYKTSRLLDIMDIIDLNFRVAGIQFCRVVVADADFVKSKFPVDFNSLGFYSQVTHAIYLYPKPLTPLYTVGLITAHEYAHYMDDKLDITNEVFSSKLTRELEQRHISREQLLRTSSSYSESDIDKEIFATAYHQLFTGTQTDGSAMVLRLAERCSDFHIDRSELKLPGILERLLFSKNNMKLAV